VNVAKERKHDYTNMVCEMRRVIAQVGHEKLSHDRMLDLRQQHVFANDSYKRLTAIHQAAICAMTDAATQAWHACGAIVWTHEVNGKIVVSQSEDYDVSAIDTTKSRHRWANGFNVWYEGK
jgi:hypothetical protein